MNDYEYIVGVDENGQPYIEHAGGLRSAASNAIGGIKSGANRGGKYIMKVATTYGNRYFYTPQEVAAYQKAKTKVSPANSRPTVERITKATPAVLKNTSNKARSSVKAYKDYQNKASAETWTELKKHPAAMKAEMARRKVAEAGETVENASNKAKEKASEVGSSLKSKSDRMREEFRKKFSEANEAIEKTTDQVKDKASSTTTNLKETTKDLKDKASAVGKDLVDKAEDVKDKVALELMLKDPEYKKASEAQDQAQRLYNLASNNWDKVRGSEKNEGYEDAKEALREAEELLKKTKQDTARIQNKYLN